VVSLILTYSCANLSDVSFWQGNSKWKCVDMCFIHPPSVCCVAGTFNYRRLLDLTDWNARRCCFRKFASARRRLWHWRIKLSYLASAIQVHILRGEERGTRWCSWLRHCATSRKVAGSIPCAVTGIFYWHNPSGRTMVGPAGRPDHEHSTTVITIRR